MRMGYVQAAAGLAASAFGSELLPSSSGSDSGGAGGGASNVDVAVSPTFQQQFTPQFSPVLQQSQGGGSQTASTEQTATGGQTAGGGAPGLDVPGLEFPDFSDQASPEFSPVLSAGVPGNNWIVWGIVAAAAVTAFVIMKQPKTKPTASGFSGRLIEHGS